MATMQEEIEKYKAQVNQYDAGRPTTPSGERPGLKIAQPQQPASFQPAESAGMSVPAPNRAPIVIPDRPVSGTGRQLAGLADAISSGTRRFMNASNDFTEGKYLGTNPALQPQSPAQQQPSAAAKQQATTTNPLGGKYDETAWRNGGNGSGAAAPSGNAFAGNFAAKDAQGQGIYQDPATGRVSMRLTGESGDKFMKEQPIATASTAEEMAARRKAMGEYGGMFKQDAPKTARPGITLQSSPVEYKRNVVGAKTVGGLPAEETFAPTRAAQRDAPAMTGNPLVDQRVMEGALARKQMDVMDAERASKSLLYAPGTRDFISPTLSDAQMRERQAEIAAQRIRDREDVVAGQISSAATKALDDQTKGVTSDRNLAMIPYAERRAAINNRNELMKMNSDMQQKRLAAEDSAANRADDMEKARIKDATDRYVADKNTELAQTNAQVAAQSKALDREATLKAALLKQEGVKDPIILEKLKGYNSALEAALAMPGAELTEDYLTSLQKKYGVEGLFAKSTQTDRPAPPASR